MENTVNHLIYVSFTGVYPLYDWLGLRGWMRTELDIWCVLICPRGSKAPEAAEPPGRDECKGELVADLLKASLLRGSKGWLETGLGRPDVDKDPPRAGEWGALEG